MQLEVVEISVEGPHAIDVMSILLHVEGTYSQQQPSLSKDLSSHLAMVSMADEIMKSNDIINGEAWEWPPLQLKFMVLVHPNVHGFPPSYHI